MTALKTHSHQNSSTFQPYRHHHPQTPWTLLIIDLSSPRSTLQYMRLEGSGGIYLKLKHALCSSCSELMMV